MKLRLIFLVAVLLAGQTARTVWDGVYTEAQAKRGQALYTQECAPCHAADLTGGEQAPPLAGADFIGPWNGLTVGGLFDRTRQTMPQDDPGKLSAQRAPISWPSCFPRTDFRRERPSWKTRAKP